MAGGGDMMAFYASASKDDDDEEEEEEEEEKRRKEREVAITKRAESESNFLSASSPSRAAGTGIRAIKALLAEDSLTASSGASNVTVDTSDVSPSNFFIDEDNSWVDRAFSRRVLVVDPEIDKEQAKEV
jgi:hypothetical protein